MSSEMDRWLLGVGALGGLLLLLLVAEWVWPLRERRVAYARRVVTNVVLTVLAGATAAVTVGPAADAAMGWSNDQGIGLLRWVDLPAPAEAVLGFLALDLTFYWWHRANHHVPVLWRFHNVHHIDPDLDVTTAGRFHFGEIGLSAGFRVVQVLAVGPALTTYVIYEMVFQAGTLFHHSNLRLPERVDRALRLLIVTPRMHGVHHSQVQEETNANYSVVFSVWDRIHRTLRMVAQQRIRIGVPTYDQPEDRRIRSALLAPFRAQRRPFWPQGGVREDGAG